jgi:hypothetical protein
MGRRTATETVTKLIVAFLRNPSWSQKDLERHCDVGPKAIRQRLLELQEAGILLEREEDHPHVHWVAPKDWFPADAAVAGMKGEERRDEQIRILARRLAPGG